VIRFFATKVKEGKQIMAKQKLKRTINMGFRVDEDEKYFIDKKMERAGFTNFRQFMLHHIVRDEIVRVDMAGVSEMNTLLRNISNNVNQLAARANSTGRVYDADITEVKVKQAEIWEQQNILLGKINKLAEGKR
jgi:hypothetical protein